VRGGRTPVPLSVGTLNWVAVGLAGSWAASRWVSSLVFGVSAHDATVLSFAVLIAFLIVVLSTAVPLWRATQIDPIEALHEA
jgi:ABC-type antimicrobial peptide transport system permease subunit